MQQLQLIRVVVANAAAAKLFVFDKTNQSLGLTSTREHEESTLKASELRDDEPGRYQKSISPNQGTYAETINPKTEESIYFAKELGEIISKEFYKDDFGKLLFIASGDFQGKFKQEINKQLLNNTKFVDKDYTKLSDMELEEHIKELVRDIDVY